MSLVACPSCRTLLFSREIACPFCGAAVRTILGTSAVKGAVGTVAGAAVLVSSIGCVYGAPCSMKDCPPGDGGGPDISVGNVDGGKDATVEAAGDATMEAATDSATDAISDVQSDVTDAKSD